MGAGFRVGGGEGAGGGRRKALSEVPLLLGMDLLSRNLEWMFVA